MQNGKLLLIRHAPVANAGLLCGRTDLAAHIDPQEMRRVRAALPQVSDIVTSPAQRCQQTASGLWPLRKAGLDEALWEQDFGDHDGLDFDQLPDLGLLDAQALAAYRPPNGETFQELCARVAPRLDHYAREAAQSSKTIALVVHAGVIRAALGLTVGVIHAGIAFEIEPLSATVLRCGDKGLISVIGTNR